MPPTVAQTAPAFADAAGEATLGLGPGTNFAFRAEYEDRRVLLPPLPPAAQDFVEELYLCKNVDSRVVFQQLDDEWTRRVLLPVPPNAFEDWTWSKEYSLSYRPQTAEQEPPSLPPQPPAAFEDGEGSRDFTEKRFWLESDVLLGVPLVPSAGWLDVNAAAFTGSSGSLAAMVMMDEFVNAPSGSSMFGPAPRGRSARFGFSISAFR